MFYYKDVGPLKAKKQRAYMAHDVYLRDILVNLTKRKKGTARVA